MEIGEWRMEEVVKRKVRPYKKTGIKAKAGTKTYSDEYYDKHRRGKPGTKRHGGSKK